MKTLHVVGAAIWNAQGEVLATRRGSQMSNAGLWEFPGGKVEQGETPQEALQREIMEELSLHIEVLEFLAQGVAVVREGLEVVLDVYHAKSVEGGTLVLAEHDQAKWLVPGTLQLLAWAEADWPAVREIDAIGR